MVDVKKKATFTEGGLFFKILIFAIPVMLTGALQTFYNMADHMVVGRFSDDANALAAIGCTTSLTSLFVNLLLGIATGGGVVIAQTFGAKHYDDLSKAVHTAITISFIGGAIFSFLGLTLSRPALILMKTDAAILDSASLYIKIICLGIPALTVYNFGAAIFRSIGDSKTPLIILASTGLANVGLNILFVVVFHMAVEGVAIATITAQYLSAIAVLTILAARKDTPYALSFKKLCIEKRSLKRILRLGIPAGIQSSFFSISNVFMSSALNTFPPSTISARTIANNLDAISYNLAHGFNAAALTAVGQNYGAKKPDRMLKSFIYSFILAIGIVFCLSNTMVLFDDAIISVFVKDSNPERDAIYAAAKELMNIMLPLYFICGIMEAGGGSCRGFGYSLTPMIATMVGTCVFRIIWVFAVFPLESFHTPAGLYTIYPITWGVTGIFHCTLFLIATFRLMKKVKKEKAASESDELALNVK